MNQKPFHVVIGQAARGDEYLPRTGITNEIWRKLERGSNLLIVAPRRVGKSSILFHLSDNPKLYRFNSSLIREWWCANVAN